MAKNKVTPRSPKTKRIEAYLRDHPGTSPASVARIFRVTRQWVGQIKERMERA